jgi:hypothetical protein
MSEELCLNCNRPRSVHSAIFGECGGGRSPKYTFRSTGNGMAARPAVGVSDAVASSPQAVDGTATATAQKGRKVVDLEPRWHVRLSIDLSVHGARDAGAAIEAASEWLKDAGKVGDKVMLGNITDTDASRSQ